MSNDYTTLAEATQALAKTAGLTADEWLSFGDNFYRLHALVQHSWVARMLLVAEVDRRTRTTYTTTRCG